MFVFNEAMFFRKDWTSNYFNLNNTCPIQPLTYVFVSNNTEAEQQKIMTLASAISSARDVETLLDRMSWRIFVYNCHLACYNSTHSLSKFADFCGNTACCFSDSYNEVISFATDCGDIECNRFIEPYLITKWFIFLVLGFLSLFGNFFVIFDKISSLRKKQNKAKEVQIYHFLVLNLALADLLMGLYLAAVAYEIKNKVAKKKYFSETGLCNGLGILNSVSSQVSLTILVIISFYRLVSVMQPYKIQHFNKVVIVVISTWFFWLGLAVLPILPWEPLKTIFTHGYAKDLLLERDSVIDFSYMIPFFQFVSDSIPCIKKTELKSIISAIIRFPNTSLLLKLSISLGWVNLETDDWSEVGYYKLQYACATNWFITSEEQRYYNYYVLAIVLFNLFASILITIVYLIVPLQVTGNAAKIQSSCKKNLCFKKLFSKHLTSFKKHPNSFVRYENQKLFKRISIIIVTDVFCWIPLCLASLVIRNFPFEPMNLSEILKISIPVQTALTTIVPLNSILNPYIYSFYQWKCLSKKTKKVLLIGKH